MSNVPTSLDALKEYLFGSSWMAVSSVIAMLLCITPAISQGDGKMNGDEIPHDLPELYDCSSFYTVMNMCYGRGKSEESQRIGTLTFNKRDKVIHFIYINGKRAGVLSETSQAGMSSSFKDMLNSVGTSCQNARQIIQKFRSSCDRIIENVAQPPSDKDQKSGSLRGFGPTLVEWKRPS